MGCLPGLPGPGLEPGVVGAGYTAATPPTGKGCLYAPGRIVNKKISFLIDTGCSHNLLSKTVFDRLTADVRLRLQPLESTAALADGSGLPLYGSITLGGKIRNVPFQAEFLVGRISDEAILGMVFLQEQECLLSCDKGILTIGNQSVMCVDRRGQLVSNKVQVIHTTQIGPGEEAQVCCRLNSEPSGATGLVENFLQTDTGIAVAATLCTPGAGRRLLVRCLNVRGATQELRAGSIL